MRIKSFFAKPYSTIVHKRIRKGMLDAVVHQQQLLNSLVKSASNTVFGADHHFTDISTHADFIGAVPIRDYELLKPYIEQIKQGRDNVLWKGKPLYFAKTSGTTSGTKYIPISKDSIHNHIDTAKNALLCYMAESGNSSFADGNMIFLSGSPILERIGNIPTGRLSGISNHFVPRYLRGNQLPSYETNCIEDWEVKLEKIVTETLHKNMTLISGIPPWMQMYFDWLRERSGGKKIKELFPQLQVLVHGGVNFEPYKAKLFQSIGGPIDAIETFPSSEGFIAFQDKIDSEGLLLNTNSGIFFEFIPAEEIFNEQPTRLSLSQVELNKNYALIINSNAGLWGYNLGDTIKFISLEPYRIQVTGRIKHFISAFGEHVIGEEVDQAILQANEQLNIRIVEFTVAPKIATEANELPFHEWLISFDEEPLDLIAYALTIDDFLRRKNSYYDDLVRGGILQPLKITSLRPDAFQQYMKSQGKLGGQNKVPRLSNDRKIADEMQRYRR